MILGMRKARSACHLASSARAIAWKVPARTEDPQPSRASRAASSAAAFRVKVTASTCSARALPSATLLATRRVSTLVLPEPAGAITQRGWASEVTASR